MVGVIGGIAIIAGALVWLFCRRRRQSDEQSRASSFTAERIGGSSSGNQSNSVPSRQVSQMSQAGLLGSKAPRLQTSGMGGGLGFDPRSPDASSNADRRSVGTDQRLNPWAIYKAEDQASSVSLHDDRDYSRQLRVSGTRHPKGFMLTASGCKSRRLTTKNKYLSPFQTTLSLGLATGWEGVTRAPVFNPRTGRARLEVSYDGNDLAASPKTT